MKESIFSKDNFSYFQKVYFCPGDLKLTVSKEDFVK